jgi:hypothetical protein
VLDPAGYGTVTITKSIGIVNDGVGVTAIGASSGNAITINAGPSDSVHLRGLTIEGLGTGSNGFLFNTGGNLAIENCVIRNFTIAGINISPSTSSSFSVSNTIASNNFTGIIVRPTGSAAVKGVLSKVTANNNNTDGIDVNGLFTTATTLNVTIADSEASNNAGSGVGAFAPFSTSAAVMLRNVVASNNNVGLFVENAVLRVAHSVVTGNITGVSTGTDFINSYRDNDIDGNTNNNTSVLSTIPMH